MFYLGYDIGGTNIAAGIVDDTFAIRARSTAPFPLGEPYEATVDLMLSQMEQMCAQLGIACSELACIGIAVPGSIDPSCQRVINAHNLRFYDVPLVQAVKDRLPEEVPVYLANDANAATLAELRAGALKGCSTGVLMTLGTGVGGGLILNGQLFNGGMNNGVELGHMILQHNGPACTCGANGCLETLCSATWLVQQGKRAVEEYPNSHIAAAAQNDIRRVDAKTVIDCAKAGDAVALAIFARYVSQLSDAVCSIIALLDPEVIAIGGGVSHAGNFLFGPLRKQVDATCFFGMHHGKIVPAVMGNDAGIVGAAMLGYR